MFAAASALETNSKACAVMRKRLKAPVDGLDELLAIDGNPQTCAARFLAKFRYDEQMRWTCSVRDHASARLEIKANSRAFMYQTEAHDSPIRQYYATLRP